MEHGREMNSERVLVPSDEWVRVSVCAHVCSRRKARLAEAVRGRGEVRIVERWVLQKTALARVGAKKQRDEQAAEAGRRASTS
eukprot:4262580-Pleurochrysis_carterae.AAC.1